PQIIDLEHGRAGLDGFALLLCPLGRGRPVDLVEADAAAVMVLVTLDRDHRYFLGVATALHEVMAAGAEIAAPRPLVRQRQLAGDGDQRSLVLVGAGQRDR